MSDRELIETGNERGGKKRGGGKVRDNYGTGGVVRNRERSEGKEKNETGERECKQTGGGLIFFSPTTFQAAAAVGSFFRFPPNTFETLPFSLLCFPFFAFFGSIEATGWTGWISTRSLSSGSG